MKVLREVKDRLRVKVTDRCNMHCSFCHAEGARGVRDIALTDETRRVFRELRGVFGRVHLTGGEPTLYPEIGSFVDMLRNLDFDVSVTTNGYFDISAIREIMEKMRSVNFSLHSLDDRYLETFVPDAEGYKKTVMGNILYLKDKTTVSVNTVVTGDPRQQVGDVIDFCVSNGILLNFLNELRSPHLSADELGLTERGFRVVEKQILYPSSNTRLVFRDDAGNTIRFKEIERFFPDFLCGDCGMKEQCGEGFAFVRLEGDPLQVRMCLDRPAVPYEVFKEQYYPGIRALYEGIK